MQICSWFKCIFMACAVLTQPASLTLDPWLIKAYKLLKVQQLAAAIGTRHLLSKVTTTTVFKWNVHSTGQPHPRPHPCLRALSAGGDHCRRLHHGHQSSAVGYGRVGTANAVASKRSKESAQLIKNGIHFHDSRLQCQQGSMASCSCWQIMRRSTFLILLLIW